MKTLKWFIYDWIDRRGQIPFWATRVWKYAHWCPDMDGLLILWTIDNCFCGVVPKELQSYYKPHKEPWVDEF